jgi:hypothetical protein
MSLFLDPAHDLNAPLASTYDAAHAGLPRHVHKVLEA